jgi:hypothetical protein
MMYERDDFTWGDAFWVFLISCLVGVLLLVLLILTGEIKPAKAENAAIGDSIALGTGHALHWSTYARQGMGSCWIYAHMPRRHFDSVVVSAGINDPPGACVAQLFNLLDASRVVVIQPAPINSAAAHVYLLSVSHGFMKVGYACRGPCTKNNFHPASYGAVAASVREALGTR